MSDQPGDPTVIWLDPGGTSGWSVFTVHPEALVDPDVRILENILHYSAGEFYGNEFSQVDQILELADEWPEATIGTEHFIMYDTSRGRKDANLLTLVRLNAAVAYELRRHGRDRTLHRQVAKLAMDTVTDDRLKAWGYWERTTGQPHARDAIRHNITFFKRLKTSPKLLKEVYPELSA